MYEQDIEEIKSSHDELLWYIKIIAILAIGIPIILWVVSSMLSVIKKNHREVMVSVSDIVASLPRV